MADPFVKTVPWWTYGLQTAYRRSGLRDDIATLPGPEHAVRLLERLAVEKQPLLTAEGDEVAVFEGDRRGGISGTPRTQPDIMRVIRMEG